MKYLILIVSFALAGNALAEDKPKRLAKRVDMSSPALMETTPPTDTAEALDAKEKANKTKAQSAHADGVVHRDVAARSAGASDFGTSRATEVRAPVANQNTSRSNRGGVDAAPPAEGADYNSSRSNKTHALSSEEGESGGTRAQDYNSSRSNTTSLRENDAADFDGDGRPDLVCRDGVDQDCDGAADEADCRKGYDHYCSKADTAAAPASPANHNTTRSNR